MLQYALLRSSLHIQSLPGASVEKMSRIWFSAGRRAFGGGRGSGALMLVAFSMHLHFELDLGRRNADAVGGAKVGVNPLGTMWIEWNIRSSCGDPHLCRGSPSCARHTSAR